MPWQVPQVFSGTATTTAAEYTVGPGARQFLLEHLEDSPAANLVITWNDGGEWTVRPGVSLSMYLKGTVNHFTVKAASGTVAWQAFAQD